MARKGGKDRGLFERPAGSDIWWIQYADSTGKKRREKAGMKRAALELYKTRKREAREGLIKPDRKKKVLFEEILKDGLQRSEARNSSWETDRNRAKDLQEEFGKRPADEISHREIQAWMDRFKVERDLAPSTINKYRALLSAVYSYGLEGGRVKDNPVRLTKPLRVENSRTRFLTEEEELRLLAAIDGPARRIEVIFALHTGVRQAQQFNLRWNEYNDGVAYFPKTKNGRDQYIPLNSLLRGYLSSLPHTHEHVFPMSREELIRNHRLNWWYDALEKSGIKEFRWHDLRHTFATRLVRRTKNIRLVQDALNQKSAQMTVRYTHILDTDMRDALEGLVG